MIEAVNSVIANSQLVRNVTEQAAPVRAPVVSNIVAQPTESPPIILAPYISPFVYVDNQFNKAVLQIRDSDTGEVQRQFPSEQTLATRAAAEDALQDTQLQQSQLSSTAPAQAPQAQGQTLQGATLVAVSEIGSQSAPAPQAPTTAAPSVNIAQAQIASAALSAAAQGSSASGTVFASA